MRIYFQLFFILLFSTAIFSQIHFKHYPNYSVTASQIKELESSDHREILMLNGNWTVYAEKDKDKNRASVVIPSVYDGTDELIFEKKFSVSQDQLDRKVWILHFLGINYAADITVNGSVLFRHTGGSFPFAVVLPRDILKVGQNANTLLLHIIPKTDERNTIPLTNSFLSPEELPGIFRDVYIELAPSISVQRYSIQQESVSPARARIKITANIANRYYSKADSALSNGSYELRAALIPSNASHGEATNSISVEVKRGKEKDVQLTLDVNSPLLWSPESPAQNKLKIEILQGGVVVDQIVRNVALYSFRPLHDSLLLNNQEYQLRGVTYVASYKTFGNMMAYDQMRQDILLIKETGFNAIRFTKILPHPYLLHLCAEYGLLALVDIPLDGVPPSLLSENLFLNNAKNFVSQFISAYNNYSAIAAVGLGSGYSGNDDNDVYFLTQINDIIRQKSKKLTYASFIPQTLITDVAGIDFYGLETNDTEIKALEAVRTLLEGKLGNGRVFLTAVSYWTTEENSNGYANPNTYEAQAKYFGDIMEYSEQKHIPGYFFNTMFDYRSDYASVIGKYNANHILPLGLGTEDRSTERTAYKLIYAALHNLQKVTVPIGVKKDKSPFVFIVFGLFLALLIGFLINSGKKFREDALRALVRPYNFFADIRDLRIFSAIHSLILATVVSAVFALLTASYLHFFKQNILLEKVLLSTTYDSLTQIVSYLAWHPSHALFFLTLFFLAFLGVIAAVVKLASLSVMNRVFYSSAFYMVVWACVPVILLTPLGIVLYRILVPQVANWYIYLFSVGYTIWLFSRVLKGTYIIFDTHSTKVYFLGYLLVFIIVGAALGHLQYHYSSVDFLVHAIREFRQGF